MKLKKVGIITLFGNYNYGNRLQNYAVHKICEENGFEVETINFYNDLLKEMIKKIIKVFEFIMQKPIAKRYFEFEKFNNDFLNVKNIRIVNGTLPPAISEEYDYFIVGSDQVWNPEIRKSQRNIMFLRFAKPEQRICLSPSIGVSKIDENYENNYKEYLNGFKFLSCRETTGSSEIERVSGKKCTTLIDPTLYLNSDAWRKFSSSDIKLDNYVLVFFLGEINSDLNNKINAYCKANNLKRVEPSNLNDRNFYISPNGLVSLIDKAQTVFTDSFHGVAFSINMNTNFFVFDRVSNDGNSKCSSRITSLLELTKLESKYNTYNFNPKSDFTYANTVLDKERKK